MLDRLDVLAIFGIVFGIVVIFATSCDLAIAAWQERRFREALTGYLKRVQ